MPGPTDPRRAAQVLIHHDKKVDDQLWRRLVQACVTPYLPQDRQWQEENIASVLARLNREEWRGTAGFFFPNPWKEGPAKFQSAVQVSHLLRKTPRYQLSTGRMADVPRFETEGWNWASVTANSKDLLHAAVSDMQYFLERVDNAVRFFEPDFAAGALDTQLVKGFREEPRDFAWPLLVYGPEKAREIGREKLLGAPVFLAKELEYGGVWLQVAENPFVVDKAALKPLAQHLGLKPAPL